MKTYHQLVKHVLENGVRKENRTGVDTLSTFNFNYEVGWSPRLYPVRPSYHDPVDLIDQLNLLSPRARDLPGVPFPLLTTKSVSFKNILVELLWFLQGSNRSDFLDRHKCGFWKPWTNEDGTVQNCYGPAWRKFDTVRRGTERFDEDDRDFQVVESNDQIKWAINELKRNPMSRRVVVSAWAPGIAQTAPLPPCHVLFVFNVQNAEETVAERLARAKAAGLQRPWMDQAVFDEATGEGRRLLDQRLREEGFAPEVTQHLCLHLTQRSCDVALGVPYNLASYALLLLLVCRFTGLKPGIFAHTLIDAHIYTAKPDGSKAEYDHVPGLKEQLLRRPRPLPHLVIDDSIQSLADVEALLDPSVTTERLLKLFRLEGYDPHPAIPFRVAV